MSHTLKEYDKNGRLLSTIAGVLDPVQLTGVTTTNGSNRITVASTANVFPGMAIACPNVPIGAFISGIVSATVLELSASAFSTAGVWTTSAANANATVTASPETGLIAYAYGFSFACIIASSFPLGMWRNVVRSSASLPSVTANAAGGAMTAPAYMTKLEGTGAAGAFSTTPTATILSDEVNATPVKRHNGELWGVRPVVLTGGVRTLLPANPNNRIVVIA